MDIIGLMGHMSSHITVHGLMLILTIITVILILPTAMDMVTIVPITMEDILQTGTPLRIMMTITTQDTLTTSITNHRFFLLLIYPLM